MLKATSEILKQKGITRPTVILDKGRAQNNIRRMAAKARRSGAIFRPHFKTHQSPVVGRWFHDAGVRHIAVSSLAMAEKFADLGWRDITLALLFNPLELPRAARLAQYLEQRSGRLGLLVDSPYTAGIIAGGIDSPTDIWLKVDTGYGRTGLKWDDTETLRATLAACRELAVPAGLLTHSGHSYHARGAEAIRHIYEKTITRLTAARDQSGHAGLHLSVGDTPCCSVVDDLSSCDEIRPGNFVFHDLMQLEIGSCAAGDLASATVCPVVGIYPDRRQVVLHGGAVHLSKESLAGPIYGCLGTVAEAGLGEVLPQAPLVSLSQEHGVVELSAENFAALAGDLKPGDLVLVWPVHSCLNCDLMREQMAVPTTF